MIPRRVFMRDGGLAVVGLSMVPGFLVRTLPRQAVPTKRRKTLVVIFQRGGADGLNIVVPFGDAAYYELSAHDQRAGARQGRGLGARSRRVLSGSTRPCSLSSLYKDGQLRHRQRRRDAQTPAVGLTSRRRTSWSRRRRATRPCRPGG